MESVVNLYMHEALQLRDLCMLCQLIEHRYPEGEASVQIYDDMLRISFWKEATVDRQWSDTESQFFDGIRLMGLIVRWGATEL